MGSFSHGRLARTTLVVSAVAAFVSGCGGDGLESNDADKIVQAWSGIACGPGEVRRVTPADTGEQDLEVRGICDNPGIAGSAVDRGQVLAVFRSDAAADTFMATRDCSMFLYVAGSRWIATTSVREIATALVEAGGTLVDDC